MSEQVIPDDVRAALAAMAEELWAALPMLESHRDGDVVAGIEVVEVVAVRIRRLLAGGGG